MFIKNRGVNLFVIGGIAGILTITCSTISDDKISIMATSSLSLCILMGYT